MKTFLLLILLAATATALEQAQHAYVIPGKVALEWQFHGDTRIWLEARSFNGKDWENEGYHPGFTYLYVKDYIPKIKRIDATHYQVSFDSPIAVDLP